MIEEFVSFVIRPPRAVYNPDQHLWEKKFSLAGRRYQRRDLELKNARGYTLRCSHYLPSPFPEDTPLPCVIYCHGNSGCRADANEAAVILLPSNITVFTLDFSGSGLSDGDYVSLGWHEKEDIKVVVSHLRSNKQISCIGLWGRSMGAITCLFYGAEDPSIAGMVIDSAFSNLHDLMMELGDVYEIRVPKFTVKLALKYMRRVVKKKAKFDIKDLNCLLVAPKTFVPVLIGHARDDKFIQPHHSDLIFQSYAGDKNIIKFDGDHNSSRPELFYDSVSSFFNNVFCPQVSSARMHGKYYDLEVLKLGSDVDEKLLHKTKSSLQSAATNAVSSSTAPSSMLTTKSVSELLSEVTTVTTKIHKLHGQIEECCSFTSSNRESWGRCSSLGGSDEETTADFRADGNFSQDTTKELGTPLGSMKQISTNPTKEGKKQMKKKEKASPKTPKRDKFEKLEGLRRNLLCCLLKRSPSKS